MYMMEKSSMTVSTLIKLLSEYPEDTPVYYGVDMDSIEEIPLSLKVMMRLNKETGDKDYRLFIIKKEEEANGV